MKRDHYLLIGGVVVLGVLLYANRNCSTCKGRQAAISGSGYELWPGVGRGVPTAAGYSAPQQ